MSEYQNVEKPFLDQLAALGWEIIDQGPGIPKNPAKSCRSDFRQVLLKEVFCKQVREINRIEDGPHQGQPWLTDKQLDDLYDSLAQPASINLLEANETLLQLLYRSQVDTNEVTGEEDPNVYLIDFYNPQRNHFQAINQFRLDTPGGTKEFIIPDIVLFVNGIPLVVVECKVTNDYTANPMAEAFKQLMRYSDQRPSTHAAGLREGEPRLFHTNQFLIRTCGDQADVGSITATEEEFFFPWKSIYPEQYQTYSLPPGVTEERQQEQLIQGMLPKEIFLDIIRNFVLFMEAGKVRVKVVCRYQQYRAASKIIERLRSGVDAKERSGVVWHTQGSGKSLTMVFLIRKLRRCEDLKDFKVCLVCDRKDLEKQLGETATLSGENVTTIASSETLKSKLSGDSSDLNMVMIHKFKEADSQLPEYMEAALKDKAAPEFQSFGVVNDSDRILLMIDEAHRTQGGDLSDNLFEAFPKATRLAFTGTPLIKKDRQETLEHKTIERFGGYIDKYKLQDAVDDGVTVQILYEGKAADTAIERKAEFDSKVNEAAGKYVTSQLRKSENVAQLKQEAAKEQVLFEDLLQQRTQAEIIKLKQKWGTTGDLLEAEQRIGAIAQDMVNHYIDNILPNGFKAQVVCNSKLAAVRYKNAIDQALRDRLALEQAKPLWASDNSMPEDEVLNYRDQQRCEQIAFLQSAVIISSDGTNEPAIITAARRLSAQLDAVENFKRQFDYDDPAKQNTGIAFLVVCDMLLTGFDAPIEQIMYIDKKIRGHNLLQTIARVNRVSKGKGRGYIVDYIGLTNHLKEALSIYAADDQADIEAGLKDINHEILVLENRYHQLVNLFLDGGVARIEAFVEQTTAETVQNQAVLEQAIELMKELKQRSSFETYLKQFMQSMDIVLPNPAAGPFRIPAKRFGFIMSQVKERYKDDSLNFSGAGDKIQQLINKHLISLGINPQIPPVELFSEHFIESIKEKAPKSQASEMEHAIRKHCKVNLDKDPERYKRISERLEALIQKHQDDWEALALELFNLRTEAVGERETTVDGVTAQAAPFYDLVAAIAFPDKQVPPIHQEGCKQFIEEVITRLQETINIINFWGNPPEVKALEGSLSDLVLFTGIDEMIEHQEQLVTDIVGLARARHQELVE